MKKLYFGRIKMKSLLFLLFMIMMTGILAGCGSKGRSIDPATDPRTLKDLKVGIVTGTIYDQLAQETWADSEIYYFNTYVDAISSLTSGKIDCILGDNSSINMYVAQKPEVTVMDQQLTEEPYGLIFQKSDSGAALRDEFNEQLAKWKEDGTLDEWINIWLYGSEEDRPVLDPSGLPATNGTLKVNYYGQDPPMDYAVNGLPAGLAAQLTYSFCKERGYGLKMDMTQGDSMIAGVISGKYDISSSSWSITEERKQSVYFSDTFYTGGSAVMIASGKAADTGFISGIKTSFNNTFIKENRWKEFLGGIGITLAVTVLSLIFGTGIGFLLYLCYRKNPKVLEPVMNFISWLISGMPEVLLLLILFYIVFGSFDINGMWIAIVGFTLIVSINVYGMFFSSVKAIDKGQTEGALALGYTDDKTFFRIVSPQALTYIMPSYNAMVVSLIKSTAIVGYVAVKDLTKVSDIVRSRTFEAFFPLIATAIIYYLLAWILLKAVALIQKHLFPVRRDPNAILKGVEQEESHD